eukprot:scaffold21484_cov123-Isochrysis_galbana.AAC.5
MYRRLRERCIKATSLSSEGRLIRGIAIDHPRAGRPQRRHLIVKIRLVIAVEPLAVAPEDPHSILGPAARGLILGALECQVVYERGGTYGCPRRRVPREEVERQEGGGEARVVLLAPLARDEPDGGVVALLGGVQLHAG